MEANGGLRESKRIGRNLKELSEWESKETDREKENNIFVFVFTIELQCDSTC